VGRFILATRDMRRFGLRYELTGWFLLIGVVPAAVASAYTYSVARTGLFRESVALMRADADASVDRLGESFEAASGQLALVARQVSQRVLEARSKQPPRPRSKTSPRVNFEPAASLLVSWGGRAPVPIETWTVVDTAIEPRLAFVEGQPGAFGAMSEQDRALAMAAQSSEAGTVVFGGAVTSTQTARRVLTFATRIPGAEGEAIGSLHGEIPVDWLQKALEVRATPGGSLWVFDHRGQLVLTTDRRPDADTLAAPLSATKAGDGGERGRIQVGSDAVSAVALPLAVPGSDKSWTVAVSAPERLIAARADPWRHAALVAGLAVAVGMCAALISARMTKPIRTLETGARRIAQGELDFDLQPRGHNELQALAGSFHQMAYTLKRAQERLNKAERMAAIGEVSLAIDHELNHAVTAVIAAAERLERLPDLPASVREHVTLIYGEAVQMRDVMKKLEHVHEQTRGPADVPAVEPGAEEVR
jgi:HAMP domain-containing protein